MSADLGPGTPLIFIGPDDVNDPSGLTLEALYFAYDVIPNLVCQAPLVSLKGSPGNFVWYCACRFRPLGEGGEELTEEEINLPKVTEPCLT